MSQSIKNADLVDLSEEDKPYVASVPRSPTDNPEIATGRRVLVQTKRSRELKFYIMLEVVEERDSEFLGKVIGPQGYSVPPEVLYPGEYFKFEFDGLTLDDLVRFEEKHVWKTT